MASSDDVYNAVRRPGLGLRRSRTELILGVVEAAKHYDAQRSAATSVEGDFLRLVLWSVSGAEQTWLAARGGRIPQQHRCPRRRTHLRAEPIATTGAARWRGGALNRLTWEHPCERWARVSEILSCCE
jgi:hypothetical protein